MITYCFFIWILTQGCFVPKLVEIGSVVLEKKIFYISSIYFRYFGNNLPLEKGLVLHLNKLESPSPKDALCQVWLKLTQWFQRTRTKGWNQQTDLKTEYPYHSCLHEVTFIKSPFECSNSNLVHQQNTIKQLFKLHSSKITLLLFQHNFLKVKSWKSAVIRSFHMKCRKKSGIAQIRNDPENQEVLDRLHWQNLKIFFSRTTEPFSTKLGTKHPWVKGIQVYSNEGPRLFPTKGR